MNNKVEKKINCCYKCEHFKDLSNGLSVCSKTELEIHFPLSYIPSWCPLDKIKGK